MTTQPILRGLTTVAYQTTDMAAAQRWYTELFGIEPYFVTPPMSSSALATISTNSG